MLPRYELKSGTVISHEERAVHETLLTLPSGLSMVFNFERLSETRDYFNNKQ